MVLEPTNWRASTEQAACRETGRGPGGLRQELEEFCYTLPGLSAGAGPSVLQTLVPLPVQGGSERVPSDGLAQIQ